MFLNYLALGMMLTGLVVVYYTFIYIHELPYEAAKHRNHPQQDAIYVACWLSLFTLHAIWPLVYIWALSHKEPQEGVRSGDMLSPASPANNVSMRITDLERRLAQLELQSSLPSVASSTKGLGSN